MIKIKEYDLVVLTEDIKGKKLEYAIFCDQKIEVKEIAKLYK